MLDVINTDRSGYQFWYEVYKNVPFLDIAVLLHIKCETFTFDIFQTVFIPELFFYVIAVLQQYFSDSFSWIHILLYR